MRRHYRALLVMAVLVPALSLDLQPPAQAQSADCRVFPETGKSICGRMLTYWQEHGGLAQLGLPLSDERPEISELDGKTYTVTYFERAVLERHPENTAPYDILGSLLGLFTYQQKYPKGTPGQQPNTTPGSILFPETGKRLGGRFLAYWQANGGLAQQGYPITDEFTEMSDLDGKPYRAQYFERAVFEHHPENAAPYDVLLTQLGTQRLAATAKIEPGLQAQYAGNPRAVVTYLVMLAEQADTSNNIADPDERARYVYEKLRQVADATQPPVAALLRAQQELGNVTRFEGFWITNGFTVEGNLASVRAVAALPQVATVHENQPVTIDPPVGP
jgi:hypothetical protein